MIEAAPHSSAKRTAVRKRPQGHLQRRLPPRCEMLPYQCSRGPVVTKPFRRCVAHRLAFTTQIVCSEQRLAHAHSCSAGRIDGCCGHGPWRGTVRGRRSSTVFRHPHRHGVDLIPDAHHDVHILIADAMGSVAPAHIRRAPKSLSTFSLPGIRRQRRAHGDSPKPGWWSRPACHPPALDPLLPFRIGPMNEREARESGLRLKT